MDILITSIVIEENMELSYHTAAILNLCKLDPDGPRFRIGNIKIRKCHILKHTKMLVRKIYPWGAWEPYLATRL